MKINWVIEGYPGGASGGCKIIFQYANHFAQCGHDVTIIYEAKEVLRNYKAIIPHPVRLFIQKFRTKIGPSWFALDSRINRCFVQNLNNQTVPDGDVIFATAIETAELVKNLSPCKGKKYYLIQDFENWNFLDEEVYKTYGFGMTNIAIATWLRDLVQNYDQGNTVLIPNAIDTNVFYVTVPPEKRNPHSISMIYQKGEHKGFKYGYEALLKLKEKYPDMQCRIFSAQERPAEWPDWIEFKHKASETQLIEIYNSSAVFMCSSVIEGYGLCGAESMACGCALVSSGHPGVFTYAKADETALITGVKSADALYNAVSRLFDNNKLRIRLAYSGNKSIKELSWDKAFAKMDKLLLEKV